MQVHRSILILVIIVACLCSYFNALFGDFVWDDQDNIISNPYVKSIRFLPKFFIQDYGYVSLESVSSHYYRPLLLASFLFDYIIWKDNPLGYHLTNILFHTLSCILLFVFVHLLTKDKTISFVSALLFSVHPLHTEVVSWISGRVDSIPLIFFLLSLIFFLKYAADKKAFSYLASLLCFFISLLGKEMAVTLPLVVILIDYLFFSQANIKSVIRNFRRFHISFFIVFVLYLVLRFYAMGEIFVNEHSQEGINFLSGTHTFWRFFTVAKIFLYYVKILFLPLSLNALHFFSASNFLLEPAVLIGAFVLLLLIFIVSKNIKKYPVLSFSIIWVFITMLPVSNIFPQGNIFAERYMYIPSAGFCIGIGFLFHWLANKNIKTHRLIQRKTLYIIFFLIIIILSKVSFERNKAWKNDLALWSQTVKLTPNNANVHLNLSAAYYNLNLFDEALTEIKASLQISPSSSEALFTLGSIYLKKGLIDEAIVEFEKVIKMYPEHSKTYASLSAAYFLKNKYKEAIEAAIIALKKNPYLDAARYNLAISYAGAGLIDEAIGTYEKYLQNNPNYPNAHTEVGLLYYRKGNYLKAKEHWLTALNLAKDYQPAKNALRLLSN